MSVTIDNLIENAKDILSFIEDFDEDMNLKDLKVWLPSFKDFLDGYDENISIKQLKEYLNKILS